MFRNLLAVIAASRMVRMHAPITGDIQVISINQGERTTITLPLNPDTSCNGVQSMFFNNRKGHLVVKPLKRSGTRSRDFEVIKSFGEAITESDRVWLSGWLGERPEDFGVQDYKEVTMENGTLAWLIPGGNNWVINVHGRKANRAETLRVAPLFKDMNYTQLIISHETDPKPAGLGTRTSNLGATDWKQVQTAVEYAVASGAKNIVLYGWSLGCLLIGQYLKNGDVASQVTKVVLDSPLLDYQSTLRIQSVSAGFPSAFADLVMHKLKTSWILNVLGLQRKEVPDLIHNLNKPVLVFYSQLDGYVAMSRIGEFAAYNDSAVIDHFVGARHCRLYNQDPERYQAAIRSFLA